MGGRRARVTRDPVDVRRALRFLRELRDNNTRPWFAEHRATWDDHLRPEWEDLVTGLIATATAFDERYAYVDPRTCLFRLARDIRFREDKTPYKTRVAAWISPFGKNGANPGFYVQLSPGECRFAAGVWEPEKEQLQALRRHFAEQNLRPFERLLGAKALQPYLPLRTDPLKVVPRGLPKDHPRPELVRARRFILRRAYTDAQVARDGAFATFRAAMRDCAAFVAYIDLARARPDDD